MCRIIDQVEEDHVGVNILDEASDLLQLVVRARLNGVNGVQVSAAIRERDRLRCGLTTRQRGVDRDGCAAARGPIDHKVSDADRSVDPISQDGRAILDGNVNRPTIPRSANVSQLEHHGALHCGLVR